MEEAIIRGIAHDTTQAKITLRSIPDRPGVAAEIFETLADARVNIDMIVQNSAEDGDTDLSFTVPSAQVEMAREAVSPLVARLGAEGMGVDPDIAKVSLVGAGMKSSPGVAARVFRTLADAWINIEMISTSTIRVSCVVRREKAADAVRALHAEFDPPVIVQEAGAGG